MALLRSKVTVLFIVYRASLRRCWLCGPQIEDLQREVQALEQRPNGRAIATPTPRTAVRMGFGLQGFYN